MHGALPFLFKTLACLWRPKRVCKISRYFGTQMCQNDTNTVSKCREVWSNVHLYITKFWNLSFFSLIFFSKLYTVLCHLKEESSQGLNLGLQVSISVNEH